MGMIMIPFLLTTLYLYILTLATCSQKEGGILDNLLSLVIAPIFVGIIMQLVSHWLDEKKKY